MQNSPRSSCARSHEGALPRAPAEAAAHYTERKTEWGTVALSNSIDKWDPMWVCDYNIVRL
jgi:hypothetical protein